MLKRKILLAEDDEDDQEFFTGFMETRSDVLLMPIAENGIVVFDYLNGIAEKSDLPDFIILDQNMPKQNGLQTLTMLKSDIRYAFIPVFIYSTYTDESLIEKGMKAGAHLVVSKPISKAGYDEMINTFLQACG